MHVLLTKWCQFLTSSYEVAARLPPNAAVNCRNAVRCCANVNASLPNDKSGFDPLPATVIEWPEMLRKWRLNHQRMSARQVSKGDATFSRCDATPSKGTATLSQGYATFSRSRRVILGGSRMIREGLGDNPTAPRETTEGLRANHEV
jgi:hypothetical protein